MAAVAVEERPKMEKEKKKPEAKVETGSVPVVKEDSIFGKDTSILSMDLQGLESALNEDEMGAAGDVKNLDLGGIQLLGKGEFKDKAGEQGNSGTVKTDVVAQGSQTQVPEKKKGDGRDLKTIQEIGSDMEEVSLGSNGGNDKSTCCREEPAPKKPERAKGNEKAGDVDGIEFAPPPEAKPGTSSGGNAVYKKLSEEATGEGSSVPKLPDKVPTVSSMSTIGKAIRNSLFMCCTKNTTTDDLFEETNQQGEAQRGNTPKKAKMAEMKKKNEKKDESKVRPVDAAFTTAETFKNENQKKIEKKDVPEVGAKPEAASASVGNNEKNEEAADSASDGKDDSMFGKDTSTLSMDLRGLESAVPV